MKISHKQIYIKDLLKGYEEKGRDGIDGVVAYNGKLDVRPAYQREYVYDKKDRDEVIRTILKGFPLNIMYWYKINNNKYELMDGQQRTISICRYGAKGEQSFSVDEIYYFGLLEDIKQKFDNYLLDIYICEGNPSEVHEWFKIINIAGKELTPQELRNTVYIGPWLADAKIHFSKPNCAAYSLANKYINGSPIRQEYLEKAIKWISNDKIEEYMGKHQHDPNANELWTYFRNVIEWIDLTFPKYRKEMKGLDWGWLYDKYHNQIFNTQKLEEQIQELMIDDDITNKKGIFEYVLTGNENKLNIRAFTPQMKREAYERQKGICTKCKKKFSLEEMQADHITPWSKGGKTSADNCQMLCADCNRRKSNI